MSPDFFRVGSTTPLPATINDNVLPHLGGCTRRALTGFQMDDSRETKPPAKAGVKRKRAAKSRAASAAGVPRGADA